MAFNSLNGRGCRQVLSSSRARRENGIVLHWANSPMEHNRYGVAAKTSCGGAVVRNRIRRWGRELFMKWDSGIAQGFDIVMIARDMDIAKDYQRFKQYLATVLTKAGLAADELTVDNAALGR